MSPEDPEQEGVDVEQARHEHQCQGTGDDEIVDRVDAEDLQRVELLADLTGAEVRRDGGPCHARDDDSRHALADLADGAQHEEAAEAIQRSEDGQEVRGLQTRCRVAEADCRDQQREPAQAQREQELRDELLAVRKRRTHR